MAGKVAVVTDTTACIPLKRAHKLGIKTVPIELIINGKAYKDGIDITPEEFYEILEKAETLPTTSGAIPTPYINVYKKLLEETQDIVCLTEPRKFSGMYGAAKLAAEMVQKENPKANITVLDCSSAAAGLGLTAIAAAEAAKSSKELSEVVKTAQDIMQKVNLFAYIDSLYYLVKGGRVPKVAYIANSFLQIKPVFTVHGGDAHNVALPRTEKGAFKELLRQMGKAAKAGSSLRVAIMHAAAPDRAARLEKAMKEIYNCRDIFITEFTPVMGVHTGPGVVGAAFYEYEG